MAESTLTREERIALANRRTGLLVFQISWIMVFVCLMLVNVQIRANFTAWPPEGVVPLERVLPTIATIGLIVSGVFAWRGLNAIRADRAAALRQNWLLAILLGAGFIAIMAYEWVTVPFSEQYGALFRVMTAFHAVHALVIGGLMLRVYRRAAAGAYSAADHWAVEGAAKLWYFVVAAWMLFYAVLYII
ncbi:MAG: heme-copper oxidase subunit III [Anaerolineae bacterium]|nr:heme-copper oxidase subunit III [Anaerolineae bacterium]